MQLNSSLSQGQSLKVNITPQLRQAIYLLQLSAVELGEYLQEQTLDNPLLDVAWPRSEIVKKSKYSVPLIDGRKELLANIASQEDTLETKLLRELRLSGIPKRLYPVAQYLAGNLNDNGYIDVPMEHVCAVCGVNMETALAALRRLQAAAPAGIGARNLKECLQLQLASDLEVVPYAAAIVADHLSDLACGKVKRISKGLGATLAEVRQAAAYIRSLHPRPGLSYLQHTEKYVEPEATICEKRGKLIIVMNEKAIPKLSLNVNYQRMLGAEPGGETQSYLHRQSQAAKWLIHSLEQRKRTIYRVIVSIVNEQQDFFEQGVCALRPMNLKAIADKLKLHESTVSRATNNKYVQTVHGIFELKYFFTNGFQTNGGASASAASVKAQIKLLIDKEDKKMPLSDQKLMEILTTEGIHISRRTVMKYREELHLLSSRYRS